MKEDTIPLFHTGQAPEYLNFISGCLAGIHLGGQLGVCIGNI